MLRMCAYKYLSLLYLYVVLTATILGTVNFGHALSVESTGSCGGLKHNDYCYFLDQKQLLNWTESQNRCEEEDADLVSLLSYDEMSAIIDGLIADHGGPWYWIGLRLFGYEEEKEWSDGNPVVYTKLNNDDSITDQELCIALSTIDGTALWHKKKCGDEYHYICKRRIHATTTGSTKEPPATTWPGYCPLGWSAFGKKCFKIYNEKKTWNKASDACKDMNDHAKITLASIHNMNEQAFLTTLLGKNETFPVWIGLKMVPINEEYVWSDSETEPEFTHWAPKRPKIATKSNVGYEKCVEMSDTLLRAGKWTDIMCSEKRGYICQGYANSKQPIGLHCKDLVWQVYRNASYRLIPDSANWKEAESKCNSDHHGNLTSITNIFEQAFLWSFLNSCDSDEIWIGFSDIMKTGRFSWIDGWPTYFTNWGSDEPRNDDQERCVVLTSKMDWKVKECGSKNKFFCKVSNEKPPEMNLAYGNCPTSNSPSVQWIDTGLQSCYHVEYKNMVDWGTAIQTCQKIKGNLVSFHSQKELDLLQPHIQDSDNHMWIGMEKNRHNSYEWIDGTPDDFNRWDKDEPSPQEEEKCVELYSHNMLFNNAPCNKIRGYVCGIPKEASTSIESTSFSATDSTTSLVLQTIAPGNCPHGWIQFESFRDNVRKCYQFRGVNNLEKVNWTTALSTCREMGHGHDLLAINSEDEQMFLTSRMYQLTTPAWIGLKHLDSSRFSWTDNSSQTYQNWDTSIHDTMMNPCTEMIESTVRAGQWRDANCSITQSFICQRLPDTSITTPEPEKGTECREGFTPYRNACYRIMHDARTDQVTWLAAENNCKKDGGGHLVSINSIYEQAFLYMQIYALTTTSRGYWIGLKDLDGSRILHWSDEWPVYFSDWSADEPKNSKDKRCVFLDSELKEWATSDCESQFNYICKISSEKPPNVPKLDDGICPSQTPSAVNTGGPYCYEIHSEKATWGDAFLYCSHYRGSLASFHSQHEVDLLKSYMSKANSDLWIGLVRKYDGGFEWKDDTAVNYNNWAENYPNNNKNEMCVKIQLRDLKWVNLACSDTMLTFICEFQKVAVNKTIDQDSPGISDTGIVGIVVGIVLAVIGLTVLLVFIHKKYLTKPGEMDTLHLVTPFSS